MTPTDVLVPTRTLRPAYGFDEVALAPAAVNIDPADIDMSVQIGPFLLSMPVVASAMDAVVDAKFAAAFGKLGGLAVLNLEGLQTRFELRVLLHVLAVQLVELMDQVELASLLGQTGILIVNVLDELIDLRDFRVDADALIKPRQE